MNWWKVEDNWLCNLKYNWTEKSEPEHVICHKKLFLHIKLI